MGGGGEANFFPITIAEKRLHMFMTESRYHIFVASSSSSSSSYSSFSSPAPSQDKLGSSGYFGAGGAHAPLLLLDRPQQLALPWHSSGHVTDQLALQCAAPCVVTRPLGSTVAAGPRAGAEQLAIVGGPGPRAGADKLAICDKEAAAEAQPGGDGADGAGHAEAADDKPKPNEEAPAETVKQQIERVKALMGHGAGASVKKRPAAAPAERHAAAAASNLAVRPAKKKKAAAASDSDCKGGLKFPGTKFDAIWSNGLRSTARPTASGCLGTATWSTSSSPSKWLAHARRGASSSSTWMRPREVRPRRGL